MGWVWFCFVLSKSYWRNSKTQKNPQHIHCSNPKVLSASCCSQGGQILPRQDWGTPHCHQSDTEIIPSQASGILKGSLLTHHLPGQEHISAFPAGHLWPLIFGPTANWEGLMGTQEGWERQSTCPKRQKRRKSICKTSPATARHFCCWCRMTQASTGRGKPKPEVSGSASWHLAPLSCPPCVWASCRWAPRGCGPLGCVRNIWRLRPTGLGRERCPAPRGF